MVGVKMSPNGQGKEINHRINYLII